MYLSFSLTFLMPLTWAENLHNNFFCVVSNLLIFIIIIIFRWNLIVINWLKNCNITCQKRISVVKWWPSGCIGMTMYTANLSFALILLAIFNANSIGIKLLAPDQNSKPKRLIGGRIWWTRNKRSHRNVEFEHCERMTM